MMELRTHASRVRLCAVAITCVTVGFYTATARAQAALQLDPSVRAEGSGGASNAVFWGGDPNAWANPALLGYDKGFRYESGRTQRVSNSDPDGQFDTRRYRVGLGGVGVMLAGKPDGFGSTRLDYGITQVTDLSGNVISTSHPYERADGWGVGVSLGSLTRSLMALAGSNAPGVLRHLDIGAGIARKDLEVHPAVPTLPEPDPTRSTDYGVFVRVTPLDTFEGTSVPQAAVLPGHLKRIRDIRSHDPREMRFPNVGKRRAGAAPLRIDVAYGYSVQGDHPEALDGGEVVPFMPRTRRHGVAARISWGVPGDVAPGARATYTPLLSLGIAADIEHTRYQGTGRNDEVRRYGTEATLANVLSLRAGYVRDPSGDVRGFSYGLGSGLPLRDFGGIRFDWARVPRAPGLNRLSRHSLDVWIDPMALQRALRHRGGQ